MLKGVDDQADRVAKPVEDDMVAAEPVLKFCPISRLGELVLVDDDEDVIVRHIAFGGIGLVEDRKSVGEGTSVSVCVDLGGRRIIQPREEHLTDIVYHLKTCSS